MGLRGVASDLARASAGIWKGVADAIDPPRTARPEPSPSPTGSAEHRTDHDAPANDEIDDLDLRDQAPTGPQPDGTMLVPLDTWTRILEQIGNVHEAGQQLADARERAARAETENEFLRAQVADLKARRKSAPANPKPAPPGAEHSEPPAIEPPDDASAASRTIRRARARASRWLSP